MEIEKRLFACRESVGAYKGIGLAEELSIVCAELLFVRVCGLSASFGECYDVREVDPTFLTRARVEFVNCLLEVVPSSRFVFVLFGSAPDISLSCVKVANGFYLLVGVIPDAASIEEVLKLCKVAF